MSTVLEMYICSSWSDDPQWPFEVKWRYNCSANASSSLFSCDQQPGLSAGNTTSHQVSFLVTSGGEKRSLQIFLHWRFRSKVGDLCCQLIWTLKSQNRTLNYRTSLFVFRRRRWHSAQSEPSSRNSECAARLSSYQLPMLPRHKFLGFWWMGGGDRSKKMTW